MGKFKVGDRVRATVDSAYSVRKGDIYTVTEILDERTIRFRKSDGTIDGWDSNNFELVEQPWQPKVGDRVRRVKGYNPGSNIGHIATVLEVEDISAYDDEGPWLKFTDGTSGYASSFEPLPVAEEAQPLRIVEGSFYKTRDGRKVGPVAQESGYMEAGGYHYSNTGECCFLGQSGDDTYPEFDLIAEWVDEPAVAVAATASNDNFLDSLIGKTFTAKVKSRVNPAIVCLIEGGQPKPAASPHVHASTNLASKEAERLALKHPGQEFGVYVLAGSNIADVVTETVTRIVLRAA